MIFSCIPLCILFGMLGGQINKLFRPIGISLSIMGVYLLFYNQTWWFSLPALLYGFELTLGYGENSKLMKWLKDDELVRIAYLVMCFIPVSICSLLTGNLISLFSIFLFIPSFLINYGSWGKISKYDILGDDIMRWGTVGLSISWALL